MAPPSAPLAETIATCLRARPEILEAYLFGSTARGGAQAHSDVDVAVFVDPERLTAPAGRDLDAMIAADLMAALGTSRVDVVLLNHAPPLLYERVLRDGVRLCSRDLRGTAVRETRALSRYCDYLPQLAKIRAASERRWRAGAFGR